MSDVTPSNSGTGPATATAVKTDTKQRVEKLPPYNVVLLNDEDHTYDYVIEMLGSIFGYGKEKAYAMAKVVDSEGRVIVLTTHKEKAELKRDQIRGYGIDLRIAHCTCSMGAVIEPAE